MTDKIDQLLYALAQMSDQKGQEEAIRQGKMIAIGEASPETIRNFEKMHEIENELNVRVQEVFEESQERIAFLVEEYQKIAEKQHQRTWDRIYRELGVTSEGTFTYCQNDKKIYAEVSEKRSFRL